MFTSHLSHRWVLLHPILSPLAYVYHLQPLLAEANRSSVISKGRHSEAQAILKRLHDDHSDSNFWEKEYLQISAQLAVEQREKETSSWSHMFTDGKELRRLAVAVAALTSVQTNGAQIIQVYQAVLYKGLGFSTRQALLMSGVFGICNTAGGTTNLFLIDRIGRRKLFLTGLFILSVWLALFAASSAQYAKNGLESKYFANPFTCPLLEDL